MNLRNLNNFQYSQPINQGHGNLCIFFFKQNLVKHLLQHTFTRAFKSFEISRDLKF